MAPRLLLLPGGLEKGQIPLIHALPSWGALWPEQTRGKCLYICICEGGRREGKRWEGVYLKTALVALLQPASDYTIQIVDLGWPNIEQHLARCDVFYMCGGEPHVFADLFRRQSLTMLYLKNIIRSGKCLYVGSCGGSCMVGKSYAGVETIGAIPGTVSISPSVDQVGRWGWGEVTMTHQTGLILLENEASGFVCVRKGSFKHLPAAEMVEEQTQACFGNAHAVSRRSQVTTLVGPGPVLPSPAKEPWSIIYTQPSLLGKPRRPRPPSEVVEERSASSQQEAEAEAQRVPPSPKRKKQVETTCSGSAHAVHAVQGYVVEDVVVEGVGYGLRIEKYSPVGAFKTDVAVLYLSSTLGEGPPITRFHGIETVYFLQYTNTGRAPWKNDVPLGLLAWVADAQREDTSCRWCVYGESRGAAWAAILAADVKLVWSRVLLVAPYVLPKRCPQDLSVRLPGYGKTVCVAVGEQDTWRPYTDRFLDDCAIRGTCCIQVFPYLGHDESLRRGKEMWPELLFGMK